MIRSTLALGVLIGGLAFADELWAYSTEECEAAYKASGWDSGWKIKHKFQAADLAAAKEEVVRTAASGEYRITRIGRSRVYFNNGGFFSLRYPYAKQEADGTYTVCVLFN